MNNNDKALAHRIAQDLLDSYDHFAAGFIVKPVDVEAFIKIVRGIGDYWVSIVRLPNMV